MDFELSDDQVALQAAARDLLASAASSERVREFLDTDATYDEVLWKQVAEQGWLAIELPEDRGGFGLGLVEAAVLAEQLGRTVAPAPFLSATLALDALVQADGPADLIDGLAAGDLIAGVGVAEELVLDAPAADLAVLVDGDEVRLLRFADRRPDPQPAMDLTRSVGWVEVGDDADRLGGAELATRIRDRAAVLYAAELLGCAERMLEVATEYAKTREQFGRPIGSFQAVKHRLADMLVDVEGIRSAVYYAAWAVTAGTDDRSLAASTAKAWAGEAGRRVLESALQVHGGIGFTWEHDLHLYLKRGELDRTVFGDPTFHYRRAAGLLRERVEAGADLW